MSGGKARMTKFPERGETIIVMHQGKVKSVKWDEREGF
ncbi:MAG: XtrA/YqaO family protein [Sporolactobacillus sp.]